MKNYWVVLLTALLAACSASPPQAENQNQVTSTQVAEAKQTASIGLSNEQLTKAFQPIIDTTGQAGNESAGAYTSTFKKSELLGFIQSYGTTPQELNSAMIVFFLPKDASKREKENSIAVSLLTLKTVFPNWEKHQSISVDTWLAKALENQLAGNDAGESITQEQRKLTFKWYPNFNMFVFFIDDPQNNNSNHEERILESIGNFK